MEELLKLLKENPNGVLATVDNGKPRVRPFGFIMEEQGKFYFCTNSLKEVYKQLLKVPCIEYSVITKDMVTLRISGEISFCDDLIIKDKVLNVHEPVKLGYKSADNPIFKVFYMEHGTATISDFSGKPPKKIEF
ncbi:pyridoxamine 5'-phosphate oxidase family protein [Clostridium sp. YIM B02505]|uniref:Pyridoxamine 5'-phosphate oxidase family protein n=1 Tax=Clostridium yunnanense TaxID=2800325 RepID=A0ABS1ERW2_9CLOT|nr:pyridoxamine 5'-phosphate oxidase family protein [Clostridium yunnanense]MBK1812145.1 pyridoxamine 5'-phosphate oxidase family protein [Clostridium yunnanense]